MKSTLSSSLSPACPLSPSNVHRVYYSARRGGKTEMARRGAQCCRDCGLDVYFVGGAWQVPPAGEIVVGLMAEFQARVVEGDPNRIGEPRGIFGAACRADSPGLSVQELIDLATMFGPRRVTFEPPPPGRPVYSFTMKPFDGPTS